MAAAAAVDHASGLLHLAVGAAHAVALVVRRLVVCADVVEGGTTLLVVEPPVCLRVNRAAMVVGGAPDVRDGRDPHI